MSLKTKSLVFGYIRQNYQLYVPEMLSKICLLYFDSSITIKFKARDLQTLLTSSNGFFTKRVIKFNQNLSFILKIYPNGKHTEDQGFFGVSLAGNMGKNIEKWAVCYTISCVETQTSAHIHYKLSTSHNYQGRSSKSFMLLSQCKKQKELTFKFNIDSLQIQYKSWKIDPLFYPSLKSRMLKQNTTINWNMDIAKFKQYGKRQEFHSPIMNNWTLVCYKKGYNDINKGGKGLFIELCRMAYPLQLSLMFFMTKFKMKINGETIMNKVSWHSIYENECEIMIDDESIELENVKDIEINVFISIKKLYDTKRNDVPMEKWKDYNVEISQNKC